MVPFLFCELLSQTIERVHNMSQASKASLPSHLVVLVDNTIAEAKNNEGTQFMSYLTSKYHFRSTNLLMLTEGHTHEDIGTDAIHHLVLGGRIANLVAQCNFMVLW